MAEFTDLSVPGLLYHSGIVTDDFDAAREALTASLGLEWGLSATDHERPVAIDGEIRQLRFTMAYSARGPHRIELIQSIPGTLWEPAGERGVHHLGWWCDDVTAGSAALIAQGAPLIAKIGVDDPDAPADFVMHQAPNGLYVELVSSAARAFMFPDD